MRRVAMISFHTCPFENLGMFDAGGMNVYVRNLSRVLVTNNWAVDIYTRSHQQKHAEPIPKRDSVRLIHLPLADSLAVAKEKLVSYTDEFAKSIARVVRESGKKYHIVHAHYYLSGLAALLLGKKLNLPVVQTFHTLAKLKQIHGGKIDQSRFAAEQQIVSQVNHIMVFTGLEFRDLVHYYKAPANKVTIVVPGVDTWVFSPQDMITAREKLKLETKKQIILFVGRIDPIKGISTLIKAVDRLNRQHPTFKQNFSVLLIGGDIQNDDFWQLPEIKKISQLIKENGLDDCIRFVGATSHKLLPDHYAAADVVVLPSLYESFGLVVLEAMSMGKAVVASSVGGLRFMIEDGKTGLLFPSQSAATLAQKLWLVLTNKRLRQSLGQRAYQFASQFPWYKQVDQVIEVYEQVLDEWPGVALAC